MFGFLYNKLFGNDGEEQEEKSPFDQPILHLEVLDVSESGTPYIGRVSLVRHEEVRRQVEKGAGRSDMGDKSLSPPSAH